MSRRKEPRRLSAEERDLWRRVTGQATPLPDRPVPSPAPKPFAPKAPAALPEQFSIGARASETRPAYDLAPSLSQRLARQPVAMDHKAYTRMRRGKLVVEARIDLHGMTLDEAYPRLIRFVMTSQAAGKRLVLVITGKGKRREETGPMPVRQGVLRHQVPLWLGSPVLSPLVLQITEAHQSHGGAGAYYVYLRRNR
jgi:DNA-nicking Smr family endonuclease